MTLSNAPESEALTLEDVEIFENARQSVVILKKTFETWTVIGKAVMQARNLADRRGGRKTFMRIVEQQGLGKVVDKATASRLLRIMEHLPQIAAWRATLTERQQIDWASPSSVCQRCPALNPARGKDKESKPARMSVIKDDYMALVQENHELKKREDGDLWKPTDRAEDIAKVMWAKLTRYKVQQLVKTLGDMLKAGKARAAG
jgi:hypothetical protein